MKRPLISQEYRRLYRKGYRTPDFQAFLAWTHFKRDIDRSMKPIVKRVDQWLDKVLKAIRL